MHIDTPHTVHGNALPRPACRLPRPSAGGVTLVELVVVLAIIAVTLTLAAPAFQEMLQRGRLRATREALQNSLHLARTEAIRSSRRVVMCSSAGDDRCLAAGDWSQGWIIFQDRDGNNQVNGAESVLHRFAEVPATVRIDSATTLANRVVFGPRGVANTWGNLTVCSRSASNQEPIRILLRPSGRLRVEGPPGADCGTG